MIIQQPDRILLIEQIRKFAPLLRGDILDIGSGRKRRYENLCTNKSMYKTLDTDPRGEPDIIASAEKIPLPAESVDGVLCTQVLEHLPHPWIAIQEMHRILRPGGYCVVTVPQLNELHEQPHDYYRYTNYGLSILFEDAGFVVEHMDQRGSYYATKAQNEIRQLVNWLRPYDRPLIMLMLAPWTTLKTRIALWKDSIDRREASKRHAIGWCIVARKP